MNTPYKTLTDAEYNILNKIAEATGMDCWFYIKQDSYGTDYIWDCEENKKMCLKTGVSMLCEGIDCQENYDNCELTEDEDKTFKELLDKLQLELDWQRRNSYGM